MNNDNVIDDKELVEIEQKIKKLQKYAIEPKQKTIIKRYTDKYFKNNISNTKKIQKIVEYDILPGELRKLLKAKNKEYNKLLDSSSGTTEEEKQDDIDTEDEENDYNVDYENNDDEFVDEEEYKEDEYES